ncbi:LuxR C-terminal-related transcriptional regulator [Kitasatospora cinereorecta]|uniref:LuxR C-terminal-related transcriptional regulator n=1 Tax=Kitasatospora cinereorecta TaxID=285560 RepID=A0ABW0VBL5_9ACTN
MAAEGITGPGDGLPDDEAARLYLSVVTEGGRLPLAHLDQADRPAMDRLEAIGLVVVNRIDGAYLAVSPRAVGDRLGSEMRRRATRLLRDAERLPDALATLTRAYEALPREQLDAHRAVYVDGRDRIRHRIAELVSEATDELLTAQPGPRLPETMELARRQDLGLLDRGGHLRILYQPVVLTQPAVLAYAGELTEHGADLRVLDEPFQRMIIVDRKVAIIPAADDHSRAAFLSDPAAVAFLAGMFERDWARSEAVQWREVDGPRIARSVADRVGRLLAAGLTQRGVASRLGLSERTVAGHISRLRDRYGAQTLFQLGWLMRGGRRE